MVSPWSSILGFASASSPIYKYSKNEINPVSKIQNSFFVQVKVNVSFTQKNPGTKLVVDSTKEGGNPCTTSMLYRANKVYHVAFFIYIHWPKVLNNCIFIISIAVALSSKLLLFLFFHNIQTTETGVVLPIFLSLFVSLVVLPARKEVLYWPWPYQCQLLTKCLGITTIIV